MSHIIVSLAYIQYLNHLGLSCIHHSIQVALLKIQRNSINLFSNTLLFFIGSFTVVVLISDAWGQNPCGSTCSCTKGFYKEIYTTLREGNGTPLQYSCLENPMGGGAW